MLLINNQQVSVTAFIQKVEDITGKKVPLDEIKQNMEFRYNPVKKSYDLGHYRNTKTKIYKTVRQDDVLASFNVWSDSDQSTVEFRFANRTPYTNPKNPTVLVHDPKAIEFPGGVFNYEARDVEKAVYMYCFPACFDSPFHKEGSPFKYSHNNLKAESRRKRQAMSDKQKAFNHASNVDSDELKVLALGLGIDLIPNADADDIRAAIQEYALENAKTYLDKVSTETVKFEGMIQEAINARVIVEKTVGGMSSWEFAKGAKKGHQIVLCTSGNNLLDLKVHMKKNIAQYYSDLVSFNHDVVADSTVEQFMKNIKSGVPANEFLPYREELSLSDVVDSKTAKEFIISKDPNSGNPSPANLKAFLERVLSGEIIDSNLDEEIVKYYKKS